jgi:transcriptional regulator with XRE-family HTH domain
MNVGRAIKLSRVARGMSQYEFSGELGISTAYLSLLENNRRDPSFKLLRHIASHLAISEDLLLLNAIDYEKLRAMDVDTLETLAQGLLSSALAQAGIRHTRRRK